MEQKQFFDEQILDMMKGTANLPENDRYRDGEVSEENQIHKGIKILGKWVYFERRILTNVGITMLMPENFTEMAPEAAMKKYPSQHRPETIFTDETGTVNLLFQYMEGETGNETIEHFRNQVFGMMRRVNPGIKQRELGVIEVSGKRIAYVEFSNPAMDGKLYNLMFYMESGGKPLMGSFNCFTKEMKYWRQAAFDMVRSIEEENEQTVRGGE